MTRPQFPLLLSSFKLGNLTLKNRAAVAPMTRVSSLKNGVPTKEMIPYYRRYADGGFGLIITEGIYTDLKYSQGYPDQPGIVTKEQIDAWKEISTSVHETDAKIIAQLMHAGASSQQNEYTSITKGPSSVQPQGEKLTIYGGKGPYNQSEELTPKEMEEVIETFAQSAVNAQKAGFDGVELHGANGYLLDEFMTSYLNLRTDKYGGSIEKRVRFVAEVCQAVRDAVGKGYLVGIRISQSKVHDFVHKWEGGEKDAEVIFGTLAKSGIDFIHTTEFDALKGAFEENGPNLAKLAKKFGKIPVIANGNLSPPEKAERFLESGDCDVVSLGKGALMNKDWVRRVQEGEKLDDFDPSRIFVPNAKVKEWEL